MCNWIIVFVAFAISALSAFIGLPYLLRFCKSRGLYDIPNERKIHKNNIPRLGGVVFLPCMLASMGVALVMMSYYDDTAQALKLSTFMIMVGIILIYLIGILDDMLGLDAKIKFVVQLCATLMMPACSLYINDFQGLFGLGQLPLWFAYPVTVFVILLIVNSINLIDGIDGQSSSLAFIALGVLGYYFARLGVWSYTVMAASLIGALLAFFYYNMWGDANRGTKTFMGDAGSLILGYAIAFLVIKYAMHNPARLPYRPHAMVTAFTFVVVPTFDLVRVAFTRLLQRKSIFEADKQHIHHRCMAAGFGMHSTLVMVVGLQFLIGALNYSLTRVGGDINAVFVADIAAFVLFNLWIGRRIKSGAK